MATLSFNDNHFLYLRTAIGGPTSLCQEIGRDFRLTATVGVTTQYRQVVLGVSLHHIRKDVTH
jgi:hypothetical protein